MQWHRVMKDCHPMGQGSAIKSISVVLNNPPNLLLFFSTVSHTSIQSYFIVYRLSRKAVRYHNWPTSVNSKK